MDNRTVSDIVKSVMRLAPVTITLPELNSGKPAFREWRDRLKRGERLPRGKYFARKETLRQFKFMEFQTHTAGTAIFHYR